MEQQQIPETYICQAVLNVISHPYIWGTNLLKSLSERILKSTTGCDRGAGAEEEKRKKRKNKPHLK